MWNQFAKTASRRQRHAHKARFIARRQFLECLEPRCVLAATLTGQVFHDLNGDQNWQPYAPSNEPAADCWTVFLDSDRNGALDHGESWQRTGSDGAYEFSVPTAGEYAVEVLQEPGYDRTTPIRFGLTMPLTAGAIGDHVFDPTRGLLYSTDVDRIHRSHLTDSGQLPIDFAVGSDLGALDITPNGKFLIAGDRQTFNGDARLYKIDLETDEVTVITIPLEAGEGGVFDLAAVSNDRILVTTTSDSNGSVPLREVRLDTDVVAVRAEDLGAGSGRVGGSSRLERNASGSTVVLVEANDPAGRVHRYRSSSDEFVASAALTVDLTDAHVAVSADGQKIAIQSSALNLKIYDESFAAVATPPNFDGGLAFDPIRRILYAGDTANDELVALDTTSWSELYREAVGESLGSAHHEMQVNAAASFLSVSTPSGMRHVRLNRPVPHIVTVADGDLIENLDFGSWVNGENRRPGANPNEYSVQEDTLLTIPAPGVLANDSDPDGDALQVQLVSPASFGAVTLQPDGSFTYKPVQNFHGTDYFSYRTNDGEFASCRAATVTITTIAVNDPPTDITISGTEVGENQAGGEIGEVVVVDADSTDIHIFTVSDHRFEILNGILRLRPGVILDHEEGATIELTITATDNGSPPEEITKTILIDVADENEHEPQIETTEIEVEEGGGPDVGTVETSDEDSSQTIQITIVGGNDDGIFSIDSSTGVISINSGYELDFEQTSIYVLTVLISDSGQPSKSTTADITILVTDSNEHDPVVQEAIFEIDENSAEGTIVGTVTASDPDAGQTVSFSLLNGQETFVIDAETGEITVVDGGQLDREQISQIVLVVQATDSGSPSRTGTAEVTVKLKNVNEFDPAMSNRTLSVPENLPAGTVLLTMAAADADAVSEISYAVSGHSGIAIDSQTGELTVTDSAALDIEATRQIVLTVTATDSLSPARSGTATVTINLSDVNEFDPVLADQSFTVPEDAMAGFEVGQLVATDADWTKAPSYSIVSGNEDGLFAIDSTNGKITVVGGSLPSDESGAQYVLTVRVSDQLAPARTTEGNVTLSIGPANQPPTAADAVFEIAENSSNGTIVGTVSASDPEASKLSFHFIDQPHGAFAIDTDTGEIRVADSSMLNYEAHTEITLLVAVTDSGKPAKIDHAQVTVKLTDVNEAAPTLGDLTFTIEENAQADRVVGIAHAFDQDIRQTITFAMTGTAFKIHSTSGVITVASSSALNYEAASTITATITATDNGSPSKSTSAQVTFQLLDRNEAAPIAADATFNMLENPQVNAVLGKITATDADSQQSLTYSFVGGNSAEAFRIDPSTGEITVRNASAIDAEALPQFLLLVRVSDSGAPPMSGMATVTVNVQSVNEAPVAITLSGDRVTERVKGANVGLVSVIDFDAGDTHSISVDDSRFTVDANRMLKLQAGTDLKYEDSPEIPLVITASDSGGLSVSQNVIVQVMQVFKPWQNVTSPLDVNNDGVLTPSDVLRVINEINNPRTTDSGGRLPTTRPDDPSIPYYDVNGDGVVSPIDVLIIINELNRQSQSHAEGESSGFRAAASAAAPPVIPSSPRVAATPAPLEWSDWSIDDEDEDEEILDSLVDHLHRSRD